MLGNNAPTIHEYVARPALRSRLRFDLAGTNKHHDTRRHTSSFIDYKTRSGIKFAYAAMRQKGKGSATLRSLYLDGTPPHTQPRKTLRVVSLTRACAQVPHRTRSMTPSTRRWAKSWAASIGRQP